MANTKPHMGMMADIVSMLTSKADCATASATADKVASLAGFSLRNGVRVAVVFSNVNTVAGPLTLNVNGTGAKSIYNELGAVSASNPATFPAGVPIEFLYDGINWSYRKYQDEFAKVVGGAPMYACRAWVNFNGTGTPTIRASGNVSSITDNGIGDYTVNFNIGMPDANYSVVSSVQSPGTATVSNPLGITVSNDYPQTSTYVRVKALYYNATAYDYPGINLAIFR